MFLSCKALPLTTHCGLLVSYMYTITYNKYRMKNAYSSDNVYNYIYICSYGEVIANKEVEWSTNSHRFILDFKK